MSRVVRAAMTQTRNAYPRMPGTLAELHTLAGRLDEIREANVAHHIDLMRRAADAGARIIGFGELFTAPYFALDRDPMWFGLAESAEDGPTVQSLRQAARDTGLIVMAPVYERAPDGARYNTAVFVDEYGEVLGKYRKTHIPDGSNEQGQFCEPFYYGRSTGGFARGGANVSNNPYFPVFQTSIGRIGAAICYDRHFDGVIPSLARNGAELIYSPAVTFGQKSQRVWRLEFATDAVRNRVFIAGSNKIGVEPPWTQPYFGDSHFVGPEGVVEAAHPVPELIVADLDLATLGGPDPSGWNLPRDYRGDIYTCR